MSRRSSEGHRSTPIGRTMSELGIEISAKSPQIPADSGSEGCDIESIMSIKRSVSKHPDSDGASSGNNSPVSWEFNVEEEELEHISLNPVAEEEEEEEEQKEEEDKLKPTNPMLRQQTKTSWEFNINKLEDEIMDKESTVEEDIDMRRLKDSFRLDISNKEGGESLSGAGDYPGEEQSSLCISDGEKKSKGATSLEAETKKHSAEAKQKDEEDEGGDVSLDGDLDDHIARSRQSSPEKPEDFIGSGKKRQQLHDQEEDSGRTVSSRGRGNDQERGRASASTSASRGGPMPDLVLDLKDQPEEAISGEAGEERIENASASSPREQQQICAADVAEETGQDEGGGPVKAGGPISLFQFASTRSCCLLVFGTIFALLCGIHFPLVIILFGNLIIAHNKFELDQKQAHRFNTGIDVLDCFGGANATLNCTTSPTPTNVSAITDLLEAIGEEFESEVRFFCMAALGIGVIVWILGYFFSTCFNYAAECQAFKIRYLFYRAMLRQDLGWHDTHETGDFIPTMIENLSVFKVGVGERSGLFIYLTSGFLSLFITALVFAWETTLITFSGLPLIIILVVVMAVVIQKMSKSELNAIGKSGEIARSMLRSAKSSKVSSDAPKGTELDAYKKVLGPAKKSCVCHSLMQGIIKALIILIPIGCFILTIWRNSPNHNLGDDDTNETAEKLEIVALFCLLHSIILLSSLPLFLEAFVRARVGAAKIFNTIENVPRVDNFSDKGDTPEFLSGDIEFSHVDFAYSSRPGAKVLNGVSFKAQKGRTVAIVGNSGSGKSTIFKLVQRLYDPSGGRILVDGQDLRSLNLKWIRSQIGMVAQPLLQLPGGSSIRNIILNGNEDANDHHVEYALRIANAFEFIKKFPTKLNTQIGGEGGVHLLRGERQRLAIAQAVVRDPKVLLLDEAMSSALDPETEADVQDSLKKAMSGRTNIIIAHKLATLRNADLILTLKDGQVVERGTHADLMMREGHYFAMINEKMNGSPQDGQAKANNNLNEFVDRLRGKGSVNEGVDLSRSPCPSIFLPQGRPTSTNKKVEGSDADRTQPLGFFWLFKLISKCEYLLIFVGVASSFIAGAAIPFFGLLLYDLFRLGYGTFSDPYFQGILIGASVALGVAEGLATFLHYFFSEKLGFRSRIAMLQNFLIPSILAGQQLQQQEHFSNKISSVAGKITHISYCASKNKGASGLHFHSLLRSLALLVCSFVLSFFLHWKLGLVYIGLFTILFLVSIFQAKVDKSVGKNEEKSLIDSVQIADESLGNIQSIASLGCERQQAEMFYNKCKEAHSHCKKASHSRGFLLGMTLALPIFALALMVFHFYHLLIEGSILGETGLTMIAICLAVFPVLGLFLVFGPDFSKAIIALRRTAEIVQSEDGAPNKSVETTLRSPLSGPISFKSACFSYPTRPTIDVLSGLNLEVRPGQKVALVGPSGAGKSTCLQMIQRTHQLTSGELELDYHNIETLSSSWLRSQVGVVSSSSPQATDFFNETIADNIRHGTSNASISAADVVWAAETAGLHTFISSLPLGYETKVGEGGSQLSEGQKQRLLLARALLNKPKILILDEALSALAEEDEKVANQGVTDALPNSTCIIATHRLSTIKDLVDHIFVMDGGKVVEGGTHQDLVGIESGMYHHLWAYR